MAYTTIKKPSDYFNTKLYTGNGSTQSITGVGFAPDLAWIKRRSSTQKHGLYDAVRGATKVLASDATDAESTHDGLTSFDSDGYTLGNIGRTNTSSETYVGWNWLGANGTAANTDGTISSTVSVNTTSGFSIVSWTGDNSGSATIGHGLGAIPDVVIIKNRTDAANWGVKHSSMTSGHMAVLNGTDASSDRNGSTNGGIGNLTSSTTFGFIGGSAGVPEVNGSSDAMIAYCFAEKKGFSKFGSYTGNGNADGPFIYTGFKPAFVLQKRSDSTSNWHIFDNKREPENVMDKFLAPNDSAAEGTATGFDFLSNGFKSRTSSFWNNQSGGTYIYMAFAEQPLVGDNPATAR